MEQSAVAIIINAVVVLVGTFGGIITSNKLTNHRIQQLEKRVDKHNQVITRMYVVEEKIKYLEAEVRK